MAIAVETIATTAMGGGATITKPTGLAVGDLLLAIVADDQYDFDTLGTPAGWTTLFRNSTGSNKYGEILACYIVATSTETAASDFTFTNAEGGILYRISGASATNMSQGTGAVIGTQNLVIVIGGSADNDSDGATFSGYSITGGASPSFTERFDSANAASFRSSLGIADAIYNSISNITGFSVTISPISDSLDDEYSTIIKIPAVLNASASNALYQTSPVAFATLTGSTQTATMNLLQTEPDVFEQSASGTNPTVWSAESEVSTTWTNETI
jgi:hypothetical protein